MLDASPSAAASKRGALQRVLESLTLLTLLGAVSFYFVGRVYAAKLAGGFGLPDLEAQRAWETDVFRGFAAVADTLTQVARPGMRSWAVFFALGLVAAIGARMAFRRLGRPWLRWTLGVGLAYLATVAYLGMLLRFGNLWGAEMERQLRGPARFSHHFVFQDSARAVFPEGFLSDNEAWGLKVIQERPDTLFLLSADGRQSYQVPMREIRLHEIRPSARP